MNQRCIGVLHFVHLNQVFGLVPSTTDGNKSFFFVDELQENEAHAGTKDKNCHSVDFCTFS